MLSTQRSYQQRIVWSSKILHILTINMIKCCIKLKLLSLMKFLNHLGVAPPQMVKLLKIWLVLLKTPLFKSNSVFVNYIVGYWSLEFFLISGKVPHYLRSPNQIKHCEQIKKIKNTHWFCQRTLKGVLTKSF